MELALQSIARESQIGILLHVRWTHKMENLQTRSSSLCANWRNLEKIV